MGIILSFFDFEKPARSQDFSEHCYGRPREQFLADFFG
jgi:hypothetical protein